MDTLEDNRSMSMVGAAFADPRQLEGTYRRLLSMGVSRADVSVLVTEEAHSEYVATLVDPGVFADLRPMQGGFTGGIRMRALGPARSFGLSGSVASGLIATGIDDAEAAWFMHALVDGAGLLLVHSGNPIELRRATELFDAAAARFDSHETTTNDSVSAAV